MKAIRLLVLYTCLALGANAALADGTPDRATLEALREGSLAKLIFHETPVDSSAAVFTTPDGTERSLADYREKYVLLNFWATWCAPCRAEMPALDALNAEFRGDGFEVVTLATGRNSLKGIEKFFAETGIETLPILLDPKQGVARDMAVLGLPITVILNPEGQEIARLRGDAHWDSDSARAIIAALLGQELG